MTHLDLLNQLPSPIREQAIENCKNYRGKKFLEESFYSQLPNLLREAFPWSKSPAGQGWNYWQNVRRSAEAGEFDKPKDPCVTLPREDWEDIIKMVQHSSYVAPEKIIEAIQSQLNSQQ